MGQILSSSDVQAGPCLSAMCGRLHSRCSMGSTLITVGVHSLFALVGSSVVVVCSHLSSCGRVTPL